MDELVQVVNGTGLHQGDVVVGQIERLETHQAGHQVRRQGAQVIVTQIQLRHTVNQSSFN